MRKLFVTALMMLSYGQVYAASSTEMVLRIFSSVVQIHVEDKDGEHGLGSGVVVSPDHIATNCHVIANARGVIVAQGEDNYVPVALKADWHHDLCILKFERLPLKTVTLGESENLHYEQSVLSLGHSNGSVAPLVSLGKIKALYALDDSSIIRTSARFSMGASGSAMFDEEGNLIGINTFKSPGHEGFFYALPVKWVKKLLGAPEISITATKEAPFWDAPEEKRPYFMRVIPLFQAQQWVELEKVAKNWRDSDKDSAEACYYLGLAEDHQGNEMQAMEQYHKAIELNPQHVSALYELGLISSRHGNKEEMHRINLALNHLDQELAEQFQQAAGCNLEC